MRSVLDSMVEWLRFHFLWRLTLKILVWGFYFKGNLGDNLFIDSFKYLFPEYDFIFTDEITISHLNDVEAVFLGGGSFLAETLKASPEAFKRLLTMKIFYLGVGCETNIDARHQELIKKAEVIAVRTEQNINKIKSLTDKWMVIPDLVYALPNQNETKSRNKSLLYIPNILVVPKWNEPHWKHASWNYFKSEMIQSIDQLIKDDWEIDFLPFCDNNYLKDNYAAAELIAGSQTMTSKKIWNKPESFEEAIKIIGSYDKVVSQRFHGTILSHIANRNVLSLHHHDKLIYGSNTLSYYNFNKQTFLDKLNNLKLFECNSLNLNKFKEMQQKVRNAICRN